MDSVLVLGNFSLDRTEDGEALGGPAYHISKALNEEGMDVTIVASVKTDFKLNLDVKTDFQHSNKINELYVDEKKGKNRVLSVADNIDTTKISNESLAADTYFISTVFQEVDVKFIRGLSGKFVVLDIQGFMRQVVNNEAVKTKMPLSFLKNVNVLKLGMDEFRILFPEDSINLGLTKLKALGPKVVLVTDGEKEVHCLAEEKHVFKPRRGKFEKTIGAGDSFLAYFYSAYKKHDNIEAALQYAGKKTYHLLSELNRR